jgi:hypothetical protein
MPAAAPAEVAAVALVAARRRGAARAAAVGYATQPGLAAAGETERWAALAVETASSARRSAAPAASAWAARAVAAWAVAAVVVSADPPGVGVASAAAILVGRVRDV